MALPSSHSTATPSALASSKRALSFLALRADQDAAARDKEWNRSETLRRRHHEGMAGTRQGVDQRRVVAQREFGGRAPGAVIAERFLLL